MVFPIKPLSLRFLVVLPLMLVSSCGSSKPSDSVRNSTGDGGKSTSQKADQVVDDVHYGRCIDFRYGLGGPLVLLQSLRHYDFVTAYDDPHYPENNFPPGWITKNDVAKLMPMIRSKEKCGFIISGLSSWHPEGESSTIGRESMFIILGYRTGHFPPGLSTKQHEYFSKLSVEETEQWYRQAK